MEIWEFRSVRAESWEALKVRPWFRTWSEKQRGRGARFMNECQSQDPVMEARRGACGLPGKRRHSTSDCGWHQRSCHFRTFPCGRIEERSAELRPMWTAKSDQPPADDDGRGSGGALYPLFIFLWDRIEKSKIPSAYKFTPITQWISDLPGSTVDNVLQRKSNRL